MLALSTFFLPLSASDATVGSVEKKQPYHHGALKETLLREALHSLEKDGLEALSLRALAQEAGVSKTAPYRHFADKDALLVEVAAEGFRMFADALGAGAQVAPEGGADATDVDHASRPVRVLLLSYLRFARANPALYRLMFSRLGYRLHSEACRTNAERAFGYLMEAVAQAQTAGWRAAQDPGALGLSVWAQAHGWAGLLNDGLIMEEMMGVSSDPSLFAEALLG
jgi:AcrR family transcriptional regulator